METITNHHFKESYISETLPNGLHVILWQKPGFKKSNFVFATPFGGRDHDQKDEHGNVHTYPEGVAHFLEHKMFEKEGKDVMEEFSSLGANVNAFTSYNETAYYFSTTNNPIKPLNLLLDFVQELTITKESVEKEKGIIIQELEMYNQMPDARLFSELFASVFDIHPMKHDIGGTADSVNAITLETLYECYQLNYHPSRMILVGVSGHDPKELMETIKENQAKKTFELPYQASRIYVDEPIKVKTPHAQIQMDITTPKTALTFKMPGIRDAKQAELYEWAITFALDVAFSPLASKYQEWMDQEIINDSFSYDVEFTKDYGLIAFSTETNKIEEFYATIKHELQNICDFDEKELENMKRRVYGSNVTSLNSFDSISIGFVRTYFAGLDFFESLEIVNKVNKDVIKEASALIDINNTCEVEILPKDGK
ncbi:putative Zn-dependent peptidase [Breznakia blatticola]|uniref:Putative Zn-dependent peptidase n=1 Tax=Breznakia blatticola TaxID=1754012 RepID=A0A4R7Z9X3_9FIRM|nr:pitrilysin family protein [Breznakia blatticola]TDW10689.1 putative Zn-dependent peptidase [Breznakia blatticola]